MKRKLNVAISLKSIFETTLWSATACNGTLGVKPVNGPNKLLAANGDAFRPGPDRFPATLIMGDCLIVQTPVMFPESFELRIAQSESVDPEGMWTLPGQTAKVCSPFGISEALSTIVTNREFRKWATPFPLQNKYRFFFSQAAPCRHFIDQP